MRHVDAPGSARRGLLVPVGVSVGLHIVAALALVLARPASSPARAPVYRVDIVAAPPGPRAAGVVTPPRAAATPPAAPVPPPPRPSAVPRPVPAAAPAKVTPERRPPAAATPVPPPATPVPQAPPTSAGGGPTGGRGADVATVRTEGIEFPYPGYLNNIVRQVALRFKPDDPNAPLRAEVVFLIHRDGSVSGFRFTIRSGVYAFDLEAQGAIDAARNDRAFGPLPDGFPDDVLPVTFSFDPRLIR